MTPKEQYKLCHRLYRMDNRCAELRRLLPDDYEPDVRDGDPDEEQYELACLEYWSLSDTCKRLNIGGRFHVAAQRSLTIRWRGW